MKAFALVPLFLAGVLPAMAGFAPQQLVQQVKLAYAQKEVTVTFATTDGSRVIKAKPDCDCTAVRVEGSRLIAEVDTSTFDTPVEKTIAVTTSDGQRSILTMRFDVPQAVIISSPALVWERGSAPSPQEFRIRLPKGSPVRSLRSADLSGDDFDYQARTITPGCEYAVTVTPKSTARRCLNRLVLKMDGPDPRYTQRILYLRVK